LKLANAVKGKEIDTPSVGIGDFCFVLDGIAERQALSTDSQASAAVNLACARQIEIAAEFRDSGNDFRRRVGLDGVEDRRVRKGSAEPVILRPHDVEIDDDARGFWAALGEKTVDAIHPDPMRRIQWPLIAYGSFSELLDHCFSSE
jgi:hypothetical protein